MLDPMVTTAPPPEHSSLKQFPLLASSTLLKSAYLFWSWFLGNFEFPHTLALIYSHQIDGSWPSLIQWSRSHRNFGFQKFSCANVQISWCVNPQFLQSMVKEGPDRSLDLLSRSRRNFGFREFSHANVWISRCVNPWSRQSDGQGGSR